MPKKLIIDGVEYEAIQRGSLSIGELRVLKRYTGVSGQALQDLPESDPDVVAAMIHILYLRDNPALSFAALEKMVDAVKMATLDVTGDEDEDEGEEADPSTSSEPVVSPTASGESSSESSEPSQVISLTPPSGIQGLATGSGSGQATSA